jgi:signal transduction histidine kinase
LQLVFVWLLLRLLWQPRLQGVSLWIIAAAAATLALAAALGATIRSINRDVAARIRAGSADVDVASRKAAEAAVADVSRRLIEAQELERAHIARELHDDIAQRMAVLTMELDGLIDLLAPYGKSEIASRVRALSGRAFDLARDIQAISHRLHSSKLEYVGVVAAAAGFCREVSEQKDVEIDFTHESIPNEVSSDVALCLFRVLQEAVNNAVQHAGVRRISVDLRGSSDEIRLDVAHGGVGFNAGAVMKSRGPGLITMQERLRLVNGELRIDSTPGGGTKVRIRVPLTGSGAASAVSAG